VNFTKQNNPFVIGGLVVGLVIAMYFVFQQIKHVQAAMAADNTAHQAAPSAPPPAPSDSRVILDSFNRPTFTHDPFQTPAGKALAPPPAAPRSTMTLPTLPPVSTAPLNIVPIPIPGPKPTTVSIPTPPTVPAAPTGADVKTLRVTAIIKGAHATAIIEREGHDPVAVTVGGRIAGYKVSAISNDGVIVTNDTGIYTISLASAPSSQDGDLDTPAPPVAVTTEVKTTPAQETANVPH